MPRNPLAVQGVLAGCLADGADMVALDVTTGLLRNRGLEEGDGEVDPSDATKGGAISSIKKLLGLERVICFGDSDNDLSMFAAADESYAPSNADEHIKSAATAVIGHHDEEGIAHFLRERFALDA